MILKNNKIMFFVFFVLTLLGGTVTGCTFMNKDVPSEITPLTGKELEYFNGDQYFNGEYFNIRNQFLYSLYDMPEKIDLLELFYNGSGLEETITEAEKAALVALDTWWDVDCVKVSRVNMDAILTEHMDLILAATEGVGLEYFSYLEEYDAYYLFHGDTNRRLSTVFYGGEHEGDLIRLFYNDEYDGDKVLTLREQDGDYLFVSNQKSAGNSKPNSDTGTTKETEQNNTSLEEDSARFTKYDKYFIEYLNDVPDYETMFQDIVVYNEGRTDDEILIWSDEVIKYIDVIEVEYIGESDTFLNKDTLFHADNITNSEAILIRTHLPGGIPFMKIVLTDENDNKFSFIPAYSGKDSSLLIYPQDEES